jgi:hypothetical protein
MALTRDLFWSNRGAFWCSEEVFRRISWLPGRGGLTAPYTRSNRPPLDSRLSSCFRCRGCICVEVAGSVCSKEHCYNRSPKEIIIKVQGRILKNWAVGRSSMQWKQRRGRTFPLLQPPCQRQREKYSVSFCMI